MFINLPRPNGDHEPTNGNNPMPVAASGSSCAFGSVRPDVENLV